MRGCIFRNIIIVISKHVAMCQWCAYIVIVHVIFGYFLFLICLVYNKLFSEFIKIVKIFPHVNSHLLFTILPLATFKSPISIYSIKLKICFDSKFLIVNFPLHVISKRTKYRCVHVVSLIMATYKHQLTVGRIRFIWYSGICIYIVYIIFNIQIS